MFKHHASIFVTFDPKDFQRALRVISQLSSRCPDRLFVGRHTLRTDGDARRAIVGTTLTLIIESRCTHLSKDVIHDISCSRAKIPPNEFLRISLDAEEMPTGTSLREELTEIGVELVPNETSSVLKGIERLDILSRQEPKLRAAAKSPLGGSPNCGR